MTILESILAGDVQKERCCFFYRPFSEEGALPTRPLKGVIAESDAVSVAEGNTDRRVSASAWMALRGLRPWHVGTLFAREPGDLLLGRLES